MSRAAFGVGAAYLTARKAPVFAWLAGTDATTAIDSNIPIAIFEKMFFVPIRSTSCLRGLPLRFLRGLLRKASCSIAALYSIGHFQRLKIGEFPLHVCRSMPNLFGRNASIFQTETQKITPPVCGSRPREKERRPTAQSFAIRLGPLLLTKFTPDFSTECQRLPENLRCYASEKPDSGKL